MSCPSSVSSSPLSLAVAALLALAIASAGATRPDEIPTATACRTAGSARTA